MRTRLISTIAAVACAAAMSLSAAPAQAKQLDTELDIIGGTRATSPWIVQILMKKGSSTYGCTGEAINAGWILTARHCTERIDTINVYYSNSTTNRGTAYPVSKWFTSPKGDVALLKLQSPHQLSTYGKVVKKGYVAHEGDRGTIWGYGNRANAKPTDSLYKADIEVLGESKDGFRGSAVHIKGVSGAANHGDSGGPLMINNEIVGVCSTGDESDPGANTHAGSNYANLAASLDWIARTAK